jgi:hypothetical protein
MTYTAKQIENAKRAYTNFLRYETISDYDVETIGTLEAERRVEFHNNIVREILSGNKETEKEWKVFFCNEEAKKDQKANARKAKLDANKAESADVLAPIKEMKKLGAFGKWLNTSGNPYRKQHFNKYYTIEAVNAFLETL